MKYVTLDTSKKSYRRLNEQIQLFYVAMQQPTQPVLLTIGRYGYA